jgi:hypothetical protein
MRVFWTSLLIFVCRKQFEIDVAEQLIILVKVHRQMENIKWRNLRRLENNFPGLIDFNNVDRSSKTCFSVLNSL